MKIAIIGGGVAGMAAFHLARTYIPSASIQMFSQNVGGEFFNGGFKYIRRNDHVQQFVEDCDSSFKLRKVNGAVFSDGFIQPFPGYVHVWPEVAREYWKKTRGDAPFDAKCMNGHTKLEKHWSTSEIAIQPKRTWAGIFTEIKEAIEEHTEQVEITAQTLEAIIADFDQVIYTIPLHPLVKLVHPDPEAIDVHLEYKQLGILEFTASPDEARNIWWDYLYIVEPTIAPHRISGVVDMKGGQRVFHAEWNLDTADLAVAVHSLHHFIDRALGFQIPATSIINKGTIKGQLTYVLPLDFRNHLPENLMLLGRYAENDKRVTFDKVLSRLYNTIIPTMMGVRGA